ncbi:MAG TPA: sulfatase-like hydrolase/transferase [Bryobacteraceae bacterium]|nr:sulfatase-like hydrolase/transferase [Bryobacteraceae bacterium]
MHRRNFLSKLGGVAAAAHPILQGQARKPNVLLILTDDQRADTLHALGNPHIRTPNLDALSRRSMVFRNAYCMGGNSAAVCTPSRNMIMSGRAYTRYESQAPASAPNIPDAFRAAGYDTYHHGKRGNSATVIQARFETCKYIDEHGARESASPGQTIADDAIAYLHAHPKDRPFFLSLSFEAPHDPRVPSPEDKAWYSAHPVPAPRNFLPVHPFDNGEMVVRDELLAAWPRRKEEIQEHLRDYYAVITGLDRQIGRVLAALDATKQAENTIVIFTSDQGLAIGSHGLMGKQNLYDAGMKVPMLIAAPGIRSGTSDALVYLMDLFPTVLELAGIPQATGIDGRSFASCLRRTSDSAREALFFGYRACQRAVRDCRYKLTVYPEVHRMQLFDLVDDPDEMRDLSKQPQQAERIQAMLGNLRKLQEEYGDTQPLRSENPRPPAWRPPEKAELNQIRQRWKMPPVP